MNCSSCGANLRPGAAVCPLCGTPAPYNAQGPGSFGNPQQIDPTVAAAPQYDYGSRGTPPPSTGYGAPSYGTPSQNQYNPANPYSTPTEQYSYGAPPPPNQYGAPPQQGGYGQPGMYGGMQPPPPRPRSRVGLIIGIIVGVLALLAIGACAILYVVGRSAVNTVNTTATTVAATETASANVTPTINVTPTTINATPTLGQGISPSGLSIDPTTAGYVTHPEMSSAVDSNFKPTAQTTTFTTGQTIYATFQIDSSAPDGYVTAKWYSNGTYAFASKSLAVKGGFVGYLAAKYNQASLGTVEYYYCTTQACSDAKLADVLNFAVTATGMHSIGQPGVALTDMHKRDTRGHPEFF